MRSIEPTETDMDPLSMSVFYLPSGAVEPKPAPLTSPVNAELNPSRKGLADRR